MPERQPPTLFDALRRLHDPSAALVPDADLLERYARAGDPAAFELLVRRHGPLVLAACRRVLRDLRDAEDAFQATFLVLARKASSVRRAGALPAWLHRTARRVALRANLQASRRAKHEQPLTIDPPRPPDDPDRRELGMILDEEVSRLPERYRLPVVLCYLDGRSTAQAADQLGWPRGTVLSRLAAARSRLRARLVRRGIGLAAVWAAARSDRVVSAELVAAAVRAAAERGSLAGAASPAAVALSQGVLHAMFMTKLKLTAAVVMALGVTGVGVGVAVRSASASDAPVAQAAPPKAAEPPAPPKSEVNKHQDLLNETYKDVSDRTLDLLKQARDTLQGELDQAERAYLDFRVRSSFPTDTRQRLQAGLATLSASLDQYAVRKAEMYAQLKWIEEAFRESGDAGILLLVIQRGGTSPTTLRDALPDERRAKATAADLVLLHLAALRQELKLLDAQEEGVRKIFHERQAAYREAANVEAQEEHLKSNVATIKKLFETIVQRLQEITLTRAAQRRDP